MSQEELLRKIVEEVISEMAQSQTAKPSTASYSGGRITKADYPLAEKTADKLFTPTGKNFNDLTFQGVKNGTITAEDMRISPETLEMQAQVAESVGRNAFAVNLRRAAELINVPDDRLLEIYNSLRPYRSTKQELYDIASELENQYGCKVNAAFIREAADVYEQRGRLKSN